jgi:hypothetical protein
MSVVSPLPDPQDDPIDTSTETSTETGPAAVESGRRRGRRKRPGISKRKPPQKEIETPAPQGFQRDVPAGDVDERGNRTTWLHVDDRQAAARARAEALNMLMLKKGAARTLVAEEARRRSEVTSLVAEMKDAMEELTVVDDQVTAAETAGHHDRDQLIRRERQLRLKRSITGKEQTVRRVKHKLNLITMQIDSLPDTIADRLEAIVAHQDHDQEMRSSGRRDLEGPWQDPSLKLPAWGRESFEERFGALPVTLRNELVAYIAALRDSIRHNAVEADTMW